MTPTSKAERTVLLAQLLECLGKTALAVLNGNFWVSNVLQGAFLNRDLTLVLPLDKALDQAKVRQVIEALGYSCRAYYDSTTGGKYMIEIDLSTSSEV